MSKSTLSSALLIALTTTVALAGCKRDNTDDTMANNPAMDTTPAATDTTTPAATDTTTPATNPMNSMAGAGDVTVSAVTVGNNAAADRSVQPVAQIGARDKIIVSVRTDGSAVNTNVSARLTYQDGQVAGEESATLNTTGPETTNIEFTNANGWPAGKYRAEVMVNGQPQGTAQEFEIK
ncbi:hypothetical protein [Stenotrophomonas sp. Marseille-Q4652]|uniref:hypothetical protein n=1 Tax=Stenotrophomonas sp. Marseille-Q4652 TaxID=2866595 RepID=UPI001CE498AC|nr:hypothetical protein [Stenotrophomonas sp. Marseille-Q4652]